MWDQVLQKKIQGTAVFFPYTHLLLYSTNVYGVPIHARHYVKALGNNVSKSTYHLCLMGLLV